MNWISSPFSKYWRNVHLVSIALLATVFIYGDEAINGFVSNVTIRVFHTPFSVIEGSIAELIDVNEENRRLHLRLTKAESHVWALMEDRQENVRLRTMLGFEPPPGYTLLPVRIISILGDEIPSSAVINKGARDSIFVDQPVINEDGLIGRVISVMPEFSTVQLLTDPTNRVAARVTGSRDMGIARTVVSRGMVLDNLPVQGRVEIGDTIVSSGLGGVYPSGLVVGTVVSVKRPEEEPFCEIVLSSAANFFSLDELFVLMPETL
jgi:rod shape-determining protein MreC